MPDSPASDSLTPDPERALTDLTDLTELTELTEDLADEVASWAPAATDVTLFAGPSLPHPLTGRALVAAAARQHRITRVLLIDSRPVAFGSLRMAEREARLGWVLTDPTRRGHGHGRVLVTGLLDLLRAEPSVTSVTLGVYEHNTAARQLYARLGFEEVGPRTPVTVDGQDWIGLELALQLEQS